MAETGVKRKLIDLRVVDLRSELERRGLDKTGVKATLTERLKVALEKEGMDPNSYEFSCATTAENMPMKRIAKKRSGKSHDSEEDEEPTMFESLADLVAPDLEGEILEDSRIENGESLPQSELSELEFVEDDGGAEPQQIVTGEGQHNERIKHIGEENAEREERFIEDEEFDQSATGEKVEPLNKMDPSQGYVDQQSAVNSSSNVERTGNISDGDQSEHAVTDHTPPPKPETVEPSCPFTAQDTIDLHAATVKLLTSSESAGHTLQSSTANQVEEGGTNREKETLNDETSSMYVNVDESVASIDDQGDTASLASNFNGDGSSKVATSANASEQQSLQEKTPTGELRSEKTVEEKQTEIKEEKEGLSFAKSHVAPKKPDTKSPEASVWVIGMPSTIKSADLKSHFAKYGRVATAKVMSSKSKDDGNPQWYGYVTMGSAEEAARCITNLHRTELHGKLITVERAIDAQGNPLPPRKFPAVAVRSSATNVGTTVTPVTSNDAKQDGTGALNVAPVTDAPPSPSSKKVLPMATASTATTSSPKTVTSATSDKEKSGVTQELKKVSNTADKGKVATLKTSSYGGRNGSHQCSSSSSGGNRYSSQPSSRISATNVRRQYHEGGGASSATAAQYRSSRRGTRRSPPSASSRQSWRSTDSHGRYSAYGSDSVSAVPSRDTNDWRRMTSTSPVGGGALTAPQWRAMQSASSSAMYGAPGTEGMPMYGSMSQNNSYLQNNNDRFDAYKYSSSSRRY